MRRTAATHHRRSRTGVRAAARRGALSWRADRRRERCRSQPQGEKTHKRLLCTLLSALA
ncbi:hypothetical protein SGPA1_11040 [Streptomyces misionensis JCM 4497]